RGRSHPILGVIIPRSLTGIVVENKIAGVVVGHREPGGRCKAIVGGIDTKVQRRHSGIDSRVDIDRPVAKAIVSVALLPRRRVWISVVDTLQSIQTVILIILSENGSGISIRIRNP